MHPVFLNHAAERTERVFALRHVLAGDVEDAVFLTDDGVMSPRECAADLVPGWRLEWVGENTASPGEMEAEVAQAVAELAEAWPAERMGDRARLRLYEERGI